jgi:hypothetical protein
MNCAKIIERLERLEARLYWAWVWWGGNFKKCNRDYWGWVSMKTAWQAAAHFTTTTRRTRI